MSSRDDNRFRRPPTARDLPYLPAPTRHRGVLVALLTSAGGGLLVGASLFLWQGPSPPATPSPQAASPSPEARTPVPVRPGYLVSVRGAPSRAAAEASPGASVAGGQPPSTPAAAGPVLALRRASSRGAERGTPAPTEAPRKIITYQVAPGDTLGELARRFEVSPETIVWANDLGDGGAVLQAGQELTIPPVSGVRYEVQKGDTLLKIALKHEVSPQAIIEANGLETPDVLAIGQQLVIPGARPAPPPAPPPETGGLEHRVARGETVALIAQKYGVDPAQMVRANGLADPDMIRAGQLLVIPGVAAPPPPAMAIEDAPVEPTSAPEAQPAEAPPAADKGREIVAIASQFVGYPYAWGGHSPDTGFDCSGFAWYVYQRAGISIPMHDAAGQLSAGRTVARGELLPGDLVFFVNTYKAGLSHVGIYAGEGRFVHAATQGQGVRYDALDSAYYDVRYYGASRPW